MAKTNKTMTTTVVVAPTAEAVLTQASETACKNVTEKVQHIKGIKYDPKKVKMVASKEFTETMSKIYAVKHIIYNCDEKYRNNIAYITDKIDEIMEHETISEKDEKDIIAYQAARASSQAKLRFFTKKQEKATMPTIEGLTVLYPAYVNRDTDPKEWAKALTDYFKKFNMPCDKTLVDFFSTRVGDVVAKTKDWDECFVDNMSPSNFAKLMLMLFLQLCVDKSVLSKKIIKSELDGSNLVEIKEFEGIIAICKPALRATVAEYKSILKEVGAPMPKANAKRQEYIDAYNKAKKDGLFVEYSI